MSSVLRDLIEVVEHRFSGSRNVMRTGYGDLDEILGELTPGSLVVVSGPSSVGKSTLVLGIAVHVAGNDGPVLLVTGDTSSATALRYLAAQSGVDGLRLRDGRLRDRDWQTVGRAVERTVSLPFRIVDDLRTIGEVTGVIGAAHHDGPATRLVIIDPVDRYFDQSRRPSDIVAELRSAARDGGVAVIATTAILSGDAHTLEQRALVDDADAIVVLQREPRARTPLAPIDVAVTKNRHGPTGQLRLLLDRRRPQIVSATPDVYDVGDETMPDISDLHMPIIEDQPSTTTPISASRYQLDRLSSISTVVRLAFMDRVAAGTLPFVATTQVDGTVDPRSIVPDGSVVERSVRSNTGVITLSRRGQELILVDSSATGASVHVAAPAQARADEVIDEIRRRLAPPVEGAVRLRTWHHDRNRGAQWIDRAIDSPSWADIADNYPTPTRQSLDRLHRLVRPTAAGRLILWHGAPGTGKTTAVRALLRSWAPWCEAHYIADPERFFGESSYMTEILTVPAGEPLRRPPAARKEIPWRLLIAEDSDEYVRATARHDAGAGLGRLLNLTDGILGQGMNVLVVLTTNEELARLHPAVTRPGRCLASVKFDVFDAGAATAWLGAPVEHSATLAELLQQRGDLSAVTGHTATGEATGQYL